MAGNHLNHWPLASTITLHKVTVASQLSWSERGANNTRVMGLIPVWVLYIKVSEECGSVAREAISLCQSVLDPEGS